MTTAVDSSLLISVLKAEPDSIASSELLFACMKEGSLITCETAAAEVAPLYETPTEFEAELARFSIALVPSTLKTAFAAGAIFRAYRGTGGPREKMIADFMIGAHALHQADRLVAMDRGYLREYFRGLTVLQP